MLLKAVATNALLLLYPLTEIECSPFETPVESQPTLYGGEDAIQLPST
jgi:hypothetical protein